MYESEGRRAGRQLRYLTELINHQEQLAVRNTYIALAHCNYTNYIEILFAFLSDL
jgi:hypothetical protein